MLIATAWGSLAVLMALLWLIQRRSGDAGIVDIAWSLGVAAAGTFFATYSSGLPQRRIALGVLVLLWGIRLSGYIALRLVRMPHDGRYESLKESWGAAAQFRMFIFYQVQGVLAVLFALPILVAAQSKSSLDWIDYLSVGIWCMAIGGESLADFQLNQFRARPSNAQSVCRIGLWKYSRHPNYFFEWLHWWTYVGLAVDARFGWLTVAAPIIMLIFILFITGIPPTEAQAIKSRGQAYTDYQSTTSAFFPWPPRKT